VKNTMLAAIALAAALMTLVVVLRTGPTPEVAPSPGDMPEGTGAASPAGREDLPPAGDEGPDADAQVPWYEREGEPAPAFAGPDGVASGDTTAASGSSGENPAPGDAGEDGAAGGRRRRCRRSARATTRSVARSGRASGVPPWRAISSPPRSFAASSPRSTTCRGNT
jgi:hypothetical protein